MTFTDYPKAASNNAKKAIDYREKYGREVVKGGTRIGWIRAQQLANREPISIETVRRMASFNRHRKNSKIAEEYKSEPYKDKGYISWLIWGGTEGVNWAIRKSKQIRKMQASFNYDILSDIKNSDKEINKLTSVLAEAKGKPISINIASDGGEVFTGLKLAGLIEAYEGASTSNIYGLAASISTIIALAADEVLINRYAFFMIHNSWSWFNGNKEEIKKQVKVLKEIDNTLASIYVAKIKKNNKLVNNSEEDTYNFIVNLMAKETFLSSARAIELGLVDGYIEEPSQDLENTAIKNTNNSIFYNKLPNNLNNMEKEKKGIFSTLLAAFGFSKEEATEALNTLEAPQNMEMKEEEEEKAGAMKEEDNLQAMEEKLKAMEEEKILIEEESTSKDEEIEKLKEELKLMKEELKSMKEEKEEIVSTIENSASYATEAPVSETSIFSKETQKKLNAAFKKAIK